MELSKQERRWSMDQAIASSVISGHVPSTEFLADCDAFVDGRITNEELRARSLARALRKKATRDNGMTPEADAA